jgi:hypothetical protein
LEEVSFGIELEPESLNVLEPAGNQPETRYVTTAVLEGAFTITPEFEYAPLLVESAEPIVREG